jgi:iron-sulfur cluster assembly accessory protein
MPVVNLTETAAEKVRELIHRDGRDGFGLRLRVVGGGCSGLQYQLMFDNRVGDLDSDEQVRGVRVLVDPKSAVYLVGTTVDYVDELNRSGFKIDNPNATNSCGCGESFSA